MYIRRNIKWSLVLRFAWFNIILFIIWNLIVVNIFHKCEHNGINISVPFQPISLIGIAVAFYIGFKNNASYDRFWEGRKIWGGIVNYSRTWANQVISYVNSYHGAAENVDASSLKLIHTELIYRHIAWINALRLQLRQRSSFSIKHHKSIKAYLSKHRNEKDQWQEEVKKFLDKDEYLNLIDKRNTASQMIRKQGERLSELMHKDKLIESFRHMDMMKTLEECYNLQGKCERINNTPFPRQYAFFSKVFTWIFILLLPFGMVQEFSKLSHNLIWLSVPFCVLISWIFITMEIVGDNSEDPFEGFINDVPMTALCRTIEIDLRQMLGEEDLPDAIQAIDDILY
jgi:putative membrane protein